MLVNAIHGITVSGYAGVFSHRYAVFVSEEARTIERWRERRAPVGVQAGCSVRAWQWCSKGMWQARLLPPIQNPEAPKEEMLSDVGNDFRHKVRSSAGSLILFHQRRPSLMVLCGCAADSDGARRLPCMRTAPRPCAGPAQGQWSLRPLIAGGCLNGTGRHSLLSERCCASGYGFSNRAIGRQHRRLRWPAVGQPLAEGYPADVI